MKCIALLATLAAVFAATACTNRQSALDAGTETRAEAGTGTATQAPVTVPASLETRIVSKGAYAAGSFEEPQAMAARDAETLQRLWPEVGEGTPPQVDFTRETVVFLFAGMRSTGGWQIADPAARIENGILVVDAPIQGPPSGAMTTQAITQPYLVLIVNTRTFDDLRWKNR